MAEDPMDEIRASFFAECEELLESLQDTLTALEAGNNNPELVNTAFRAIHSIKGGAGAFRFDNLVAFAHRVETVMDELRAGRVRTCPDTIRLFYLAMDMLQDQISAARDGLAEPAGSEDILARLEALLDAATLTPEEIDEFVPTPLSLDFAAPAGGAAGPDWRVSFTPQPGFYETGNETLLILRALSRLGAHDIHCRIPDDLPAPDEDNAEIPLLSWDLSVPGTLGEDKIHQVFTFVADLCTLEIAPAGPGTSPPSAPPNRDTASDTDPDMADDPGEASRPRPREQAPDATAYASDTAAHPEHNPTIRVDLDKVDHLVNLIGELVINHAMLARRIEDAGIGHDLDIASGLDAFRMLTRDIQDAVMVIRAQPIRPLFQRMARILREASALTGKQVRLRTEGDFTEIDKTVIEGLADPLTHMIRNAIDHGLETPERRRRSGKPAEGLIVLSASHRAGRVLVSIEDDGAGINRAKLRAGAVSKGLITADAPLSDTDIDSLIFAPGLSTAAEISPLSGRGVGMDVVKNAITALGGRIGIDSKAGQGTKFSISLPLTLAVLDGMIVRAADQNFAIPLSAILETARLDESRICRLTPHEEVIRIRNAFVPLLDLGCQLGFRASRSRREDGIVLLFARHDSQPAALIVDAVMEQRQVVIKGLRRPYGNIAGISTATILGDGQVALIVDPAFLICTTPHTGAKLKAASKEMSDLPPPSTESGIELLSFQSGGHDYCVEIMSVQEIRSWSPATPLPHAPRCLKGVINLRGTVLPVIDLSACLGMAPTPDRERNIIIVVSFGGALTGLLVEKVSYPPKIGQ
ncbi:MAG: chemotaxis protein CheW [Paracoccus sp. (in: a-proteobacteria)]